MTYLIVGGIFFGLVVLALGGMMIQSACWPCANLACEKSLPHAYYISDYCPDCIHMDKELQADPTQE